MQTGGIELTNIARISASKYSHIIVYLLTIASVAMLSNPLANAQEDTSRTTVDSFDVIVLRYVTEHRLFETDSAGKIKPGQYRRVDTTKTILSADYFLTENCSKAGCFTYLFNSKTRTMTLFNWEGIYSSLPMDSIAIYNDSLDKLNLAQKKFRIWQMHKVFEPLGGAKNFLVRGWEREILFDQTPVRPIKISMSGTFDSSGAVVVNSKDTVVAEDASEQNSDSLTTSASNKKRGRPRSKIEKKSDELTIHIPNEPKTTSNFLAGIPSRPMTQAERDQFTKLYEKEDNSPEAAAKRELLFKQMQILSGAVRDGGMNTKAFPRSQLDSIYYSVDSLFGVDTVLGVDADRYTWNWNSNVYSLSGTSSIVPASRAGFDLTSQSRFDDNLSIFVGFDNPNRMSILLPMGRRFWNERGFCLSQYTILQAATGTFEITRTLIDAKPYVATSEIFTVPDNYRQRDWITFELEQVLLSFYEE